MLSTATTPMNAMLRQIQCHHRLFLPPLYVAARSLSSSAAMPSSRKKRKDHQHVVVALGGNALLKRGEPLTVSNQRKNISDGIASLSPVLRHHKITFVHGNGPQVGLLALQGAAYQRQSPDAPPMELDVLDAETEGMIGYLLEQEINRALGDDAEERGVVTVLSQIVVDPHDTAFDDPTKFIGPVYTKEEALKLGKPVKPDGEYYRRVVPSPMPVRLIEPQLTAVKLLTESNVIVICAGGGGIPVMYENGRLTGVEAVIDKDRAACMMGIDGTQGDERY